MPPARCVAALLLVCLAWAPALAPADVVVLTNRTSSELTLEISPAVGRAYRVQLASGEVRPFFDDEPLQIAFNSGVGRESFLLGVNAVYYFGESADGAVGMQRIGLGDDESTDEGRPLPGEAVAAPVVIPVKLYVDDDEATRQVLWERKLRMRVDAASKLLAKHAGVALEVVGVGAWDSDDATRDFVGSLREFEREVNPSPARIAIGFTSQYEAVRGRVHLGGTRGPMRRHIMLREWSRHVTERERLELLLHELGHFLGATHSPEQDSVMRPVLGDRQARNKSFAVRFDPVNTLIIAMVGEEMRRRGADSFGALSEGTRARLRQVYGAIGQVMPDDSATQQFQKRTAGKRLKSPVTATRTVLRAITTAARNNAAAPVESRLKGDALTDHYVRVAAQAAAQLAEDEGPKAMLLALGIAIDDSTSLQQLPLTKGHVLAAETGAERTRRLAVLGKPTVNGRRDLAKHFLVSAHLVATSDASTADRLGLTKEALDTQRQSGFSFADIAANRAGIRFAETVLSGRLKLDRLAKGFRTIAFAPSIDGLPEGLKSSEFIDQFGGPGDERFERQLAEVDARIDALLPYAPALPGLFTPATPGPRE